MILGRDITYIIRGCIFRVYNELGPGLLESVYEEALLYELQCAGLKVERQKPIDIIYHGIHLAHDLRLDLVVNDEIILELKSVEELQKVHYKQLLTYLRLSHKSVGFLVNFNVADMSEGIKRMVNHYEE